MGACFCRDDLDFLEELVPYVPESLGTVTALSMSTNVGRQVWDEQGRLKEFATQDNDGINTLCLGGMMVDGNSCDASDDIFLDYNFFSVCFATNLHCLGTI